MTKPYFVRKYSEGLKPFDLLRTLHSFGPHTEAVYGPRKKILSWNHLLETGNVEWRDGILSTLFNILHHTPDLSEVVFSPRVLKYLPLQEVRTTRWHFQQDTTAKLYFIEYLEGVSSFEMFSTRLKEAAACESKICLNLELSSFFPDSHLIQVLKLLEELKLSSRLISPLGLVEQSQAGVEGIFYLEELLLGSSTLEDRFILQGGILKQSHLPAVLKVISEHWATPLARQEVVLCELGNDSHPLREELLNLIKRAESLETLFHPHMLKIVRELIREIG